MVRWITGHNFLKRHNAIINQETNAVCRFCELELETSSHLITDCEVLVFKRSEIFLSYFLDKENPDWNVKALVKLITQSEMKSLEDSSGAITPGAAGDPAQGQSQDPLSTQSYFKKKLK